MERTLGTSVLTFQNRGKGRSSQLSSWDPLPHLTSARGHYGGQEPGSAALSPRGRAGELLCEVHQDRIRFAPVESLLAQDGDGQTEGTPGGNQLLTFAAKFT